MITLFDSYFATMDDVVRFMNWYGKNIGLTTSWDDTRYEQAQELYNQWIWS